MSDFVKNLLRGSDTDRAMGDLALAIGMGRKRDAARQQEREEAHQASLAGALEEARRLADEARVKLLADIQTSLAEGCETFLVRVYVPLPLFSNMTDGRDIKACIAEFCKHLAEPCGAMLRFSDEISDARSPNYNHIAVTIPVHAGTYEVKKD